jgi:hypothetical protein
MNEVPGQSTSVGNPCLPLPTTRAGAKDRPSGGSKKIQLLSVCVVGTTCRYGGLTKDEARNARPPLFKKGSQERTETDANRLKPSFSTTSYFVTSAVACSITRVSTQTDGTENVYENVTDCYCPLFCMRIIRIRTVLRRSGPGIRLWNLAGAGIRTRNVR